MEASAAIDEDFSGFLFNRQPQAGLESVFQGAA
jgi:hypothetical protein